MQYYVNVCVGCETQIEGVCEQGFEEIIWTEDVRNCKEPGEYYKARLF
jgi:hypothetical protein